MLLNIYIMLWFLNILMSRLEVEKRVSHGKWYKDITRASCAPPRADSERPWAGLAGSMRGMGRATSCKGAFIKWKKKKESRSGFSLPCFSVASMVTTDTYMAMYWVCGAYMVRLRVCVRCMVVWRCAKVANAPCVRVVNAGA